MIKEIVNDNVPFSHSINYIVDDVEVGKLDYSLIYDRIEIDNIIVKEEYRNRKIGTKLLKYLIDIATVKKVINITLEVRESNYIAIKLYKNFGFKEVAIRKYYYGDEDAILMEMQVK